MPILCLSQATLANRLCENNIDIFYSGFGSKTITFILFQIVFVQKNPQLIAFLMICDNDV